MQPDRPGLDPHAGVRRVLQEHQRVERVAVPAQRVGHEPVVGGIGGGREQPAVEEDLPGVVVDLVLVAAAPRDLDDDVDAALAGASWSMGAIRARSRTARRSSARPAMEFRRITNLPPYVFTIINNLKIEARRAGVDVIDLGFGNPDIPSPEIAVEKLAEAARITPQPPLLDVARACPSSARPSAALYERSWGVDARPRDRDHQHHRLQGGLQPPHVGAAAAGRRRHRAQPQLPDPHLRPAVRRRRPAPGADAPTGPGHAGTSSTASRRPGRSAGRSPACSSSPSRTTRPASCVDLDFMQRVVDFCREQEMVVVHDFAYADVGFDGYEPPSILQAEGAKECAVELYSMTKSFSMAGWRVRVHGRQRRGRAGAGEAQELPRLRHLPAHPDRRHRHHERGARLPEGGLRDLPEPPGRAVRRAGAHRVGHPRSRRARCSSGRRSPSPTTSWARSSSARCWCGSATWPRSPGVGFGPGGDGFVRFALIENEQRIAQGLRNLRRGLTKL